jgi:hypothetical protein
MELSDWFETQPFFHEPPQTSLLMFVPIGTSSKMILSQNQPRPGKILESAPDGRTCSQIEGID